MSSKEFDMFVGQANKLRDQGRLEEAVDMYNRALVIEPLDKEIRRQIIEIYIKTGEFETVVSEYLSWARVCQERGLVDEALEVYQDLIGLENLVSKKGFYIGGAKSVAGDIVRDLLSSVRVDVFYNVGVLLQAKGVIDDSIAYLKACLELSPPESSARVHMVLGQAYMKKGMDKEAVGEFQEVVRLAPLDAAYAYEMLGEIYIRGGKTPQGTIVWFRNAGELYIKNNQIMDAIRVFERILNFDPRNKDVLGSLGDIYSQRGQIEKAVEVCLKLADIYISEGFLDKVVGLYEKLIEWVPDNSSIRKKLIDIYREILKADSGNLSARHKLINILLNDGSPEEAIPEFLLLASTYLDKDMLDEGISVCEKLLDIDPENLKANEILGEIYFRQGEGDLALDQYLHIVKLLRDKGDEEGADKLNKELVKKFPQQIELYYQQAIEEKEKGNFTSALNILDSIIKDNPSYKQAMFARADIFVKKDRWNEALEQYKELLNIDPNYLEVRKILLDRYISLGDLEEALNETYIIGSQMFAKGDYREAENLYRRMLAYLPDNPELREKICEVQAARGHIEKAVAGYLIIYEIYRRRSKFEMAINICSKILDLAPENVFAKEKLAILYQTFNPEKAVSLYTDIVNMYLDKKLDAPAAEIMKRILAISPSENDIRFKLIEIYKKQLRFEDATENYRYLLTYYLNEHEYAKARDTVKEIIALQPFNFQMREELGEVYNENGMLSEAIEIFEELTHHYLEKKDFAKVIELTRKLETLASRQQNRSLAWDYAVKIAELLYQEGDWQAAVDKYLDTLKQMVEYDDYLKEENIFTRIIDIYSSQNDINAGILRLDDLARKFDESGETEKSLVLFEQIEKVYERENDYEKALEVLDFLSSQYEELGNISEAVRAREMMADIYLTLDKVKSRADDIVENYFIMIDLALKQSLPEDACSYFVKIEKWKPEDSASLLRMAQTLFSAGFMQESLPYFEKLLKMDEDSYDAMSHLAIIYASASDYEKSIVYASKILTRGLISSVIQAYRKLVFKNSSEGEAHMNLGKFYEAMGFSEEAVFEYKSASEYPGSHLQALNQIGTIFLKQKLYNLAETQFQIILDEDYEDEERQQDTRYNLAEAYYCQGKYEDALNMYQECYAVDIRYRDVEKKIGDLASMLEN